jgi:hypothetical protein
MFAGLVWLAYTQGVARGRSETPVLTAAAGPVRVAPTDKDNGGADAAYKGFKIYEQPAPPDDEADAAPPAAPAPAAAAPAQPAPVAAAPQPVTPPKPVAAPLVASQRLAQPAPKPALVTAAPPVAAKPAPVSTAPKPAPMMEKQKPPVSAPLAPATGAPRTLPGLAASTAPSAAPPKPAASGSYVLQIGAYKSQADADAAWKAYKAKHAALLAGYGSDVQQAELGEKGTWYRLRITGFGDRDVANELCDRLKADGGSCFLGR